MINKPEETEGWDGGKKRDGRCKLERRGVKFTATRDKFMTQTKNILG